MDKISTAILQTLAWFDVISWPVTAWEIYKYLHYQPGELISFTQIKQGLNELTGGGKIATSEGFYYLPGRGASVSQRKERYLLAERKYKKALRVIRALRCIPSIRLISVCNTLGYSNAPDDSDIDLFIIVRPGRLWTTRLLVLSFLKFFGLRPLLARFGSFPEIRKDRIDANFFLSENDLSLEKLAITNDIYLAYWLILQTPVYDPDGVYNEFIAANSWLKKQLPNLIVNQPSYRRRLGRPPALGSGLARLLAPPEKLCRWVQLHILPLHLKKMANQDTNVVINDAMLKFHDRDRRAYFRDLWLKNLPT